MQIEENEMIEVWELWLVLQGDGIHKEVQVNYCRDVHVYERNHDGPLSSDFGLPLSEIRVDKLWCGPFTYNTQRECINNGDDVALDKGFRQSYWGERKEGAANWDVTIYDTFQIQCRKATSEYHGRTRMEISNWKPEWEYQWGDMQARDSRDLTFWRDRAEYLRSVPERVYENHTDPQ